MDHENSFLGVGWSYPLRFDLVNREAVMVTTAQDIEQSLRILLSTRPGERIMNEEFGTDLNQFMYQEVNESLFSHIREVISDSVLRYEARIDITDIGIEYDGGRDGVLYITLTYTIRQTNSRHNLVYPFYLLEANNVSNM